MNEDAAKEILVELFASLEASETQSGAIVQFLKAKGIASDEVLAPYFEEAGKASSVRWLAARARMEHLLTSALKNEEKASSQSTKAPSENKREEGSQEKTSKETRPESGVGEGNRARLPEQVAKEGES